MENTHTPHQQWRKHTKPDTTDEAQSKKINGVFMFGCAAREITKNRSSLPALQELPSPQDVNKNQTKPGRRPMPWSRIGIGKTTRGSWIVGTNKKRQRNTTESRKLTPYEIRNLELKSEEILRNKENLTTGKEDKNLN